MNFQQYQDFIRNTPKFLNVKPQYVLQFIVLICLFLFVGKLKCHLKYSLIYNLEFNRNVIIQPFNP